MIKDRVVCQSFLVFKKDGDCDPDSLYKRTRLLEMPLFSLVPSCLVKFEQSRRKDARTSREAYLMPPQTSFYKT